MLGLFGKKSKKKKRNKKDGNQKEDQKKEDKILWTLFMEQCIFVKCKNIQAYDCK